MKQGWFCESYLWIILIGQSDIVKVITFWSLPNVLFTQPNSEQVPHQDLSKPDKSGYSGNSSKSIGVAGEYGNYGETSGSGESGDAGESGDSGSSVDFGKSGNSVEFGNSCESGDSGETGESRNFAEPGDS